MKQILVLFLALCSFSVNAQVTRQWVATYNGPANKAEWARSIAVDKQGNVYVTGISDGIGTSTDYLTIKYNSEGVEQWTARFNGSGNHSDEPNSLAIDNKGNVYVTGFSNRVELGTYLDVATVKYNSEGVEQWVAYHNRVDYSNDVGLSIAVDKESNIFVMGESAHSLTSNQFITLKYNPDGTELWVRYYDGPGNSDPYDMTIDHSGNVIVTGRNSAPGLTSIITIKYDPAGTEQWVTSFRSPVSSFDSPKVLEIDKTGNIYVAGYNSGGVVIIKYNAAGAQEWAQNSNNGIMPMSLAVDSSGNAIVTGYSGIDDFATIKYNSAGIQQWVSRYNGPANLSDRPTSILADSAGNSYVSGFTTGVGDQEDYVTIKYNPAGAEAWVATYNGTANQMDWATSSAIDNNGNIYVTGQSYIAGTYDYATIKYSQQEAKLSITRPVTGTKFIAGQKDTIKWTGGEGGQSVKIEYSTDKGNTYSTINSGVLANSNKYLWDVPGDLLTTKAKIRISDMADGKILGESALFGIKPYLLTRLNADSTYYIYRKDRDQWGFSNTEADMWPGTWYNQFNYKGTDPFTKKQYPQALNGGLFSILNSLAFPDWISWVNAFSVNACYKNTDPEGYSQAALLRWIATLNNWKGSCYGIAAANALAFSHKEQFQAEFPNFPLIAAPIAVISDDGVKSVVNKLFVHQYGKLCKANDLVGMNETPYQTLQDIKQMLLEDNATVKTLSIFNNGGKGGHTILAYGLKQDPIQDNLYYVKVYDNSHPNSNNPITIDILANGGNGSWSTPDWPGWGGDKNIYLELVSDNYFNNATKGKNGSDNYKSPFILPDDRLEIDNNPGSDIKIRSWYTGQVTGYSINTVFNEIPNSFPLMVKDGSETPPYGFSLPFPTTDFYIIEMNSFHSDTVNTFFFTGNKSFLYQRNGATQTQTDQLYFDGGVHVANYDGETKTFSLLGLINETTREKLCILKSLKTSGSEWGSNEEVAIDIPDSNKFKITTFKAVQHYDIELNYLTSDGTGKFVCYNITLPENSSHTIAPDWENLTDAKLMVLVDLNRDLIIDDTLYFNNLLTGIGNDEDSHLVPQGFYLSQNYPNPFDAITLITYQLPMTCNVTLMVFDLIGNEVATLVNENKPAGNYKAEFNASLLKPGMYFYKLQTGNMSFTKKMILRR